MSELFDDESLAILERRIDEWLAGMLTRNISGEGSAGSGTTSSGTTGSGTTGSGSPGPGTSGPGTPGPYPEVPVIGIVAIDHAEPDPAFRARWYVRMKGESKDFITVWVTLGQRTLRYETYVMPAPEENVEIFNENLLRRNDSLIGAHFSIGEEDAVFLRGDRPLNGLTEAELDRIIGSMYAYVEQVFRPLLAIGFASRFAG